MYLGFGFCSQIFVCYETDCISRWVSADLDPPEPTQRKSRYLLISGLWTFQQWVLKWHDSSCIFTDINTVPLVRLKYGSFRKCDNGSLRIPTYVSLRVLNWVECQNFSFRFSTPLYQVPPLPFSHLSLSHGPVEPIVLMTSSIRLFIRHNTEIQYSRFLEIFTFNISRSFHTSLFVFTELQ